jgi:hypothetical protein
MQGYINRKEYEKRIAPGASDLKSEAKLTTKREHKNHGLDIQIV